ncbi:MAG: CAP domain-containing protein [Bacteroidetes bacterium]|nr:CAP domain-containing protein [Bacteroidota bacterium]
MKKIFPLLSATILLFSFGKPCEDYPFSKWDAATLEKANTAKDEINYTAEEKKVIYYMNLVRMKPELFCKTYFQKYMDSTKTKFTSFASSLKNDLQVKYKPMDVLTVKQDLTEEAVDHAKDTGKKGNLGHFTSDGKSYDFRMKKFKETYSSTAENCDYGFDKALSIVMHLLIDEGQGTVEHRKTIMDKNLQYAGVSIQPHKKEKWTCVIEFANTK